MGKFTGLQKDPHATVVFASIQTLSRPQHLERFAPDHFDYVVVDEFHHAAADTYRRLIEYFRPGFLLGLTATPERTDGGDLLALCGHNLVFRCDLGEGVKAKLLSPFRYFGIHDDVDYSAVPWSRQTGRFDELELTRALATERRAQNALEQWQQHGGSRGLGFCCSQAARRLHGRVLPAAGRAGGGGARGARVRRRVRTRCSSCGMDSCRSCSASTCSTKVSTCRRSTRC
jgi:superfamily II DNA or RNA helicase